jgi:hypothetical protein
VKILGSKICDGSWLRRCTAAGLAAFGLLLHSGNAGAEIPLGKAKGWDVSLDGRLNTFISFSQGEAQPAGVPLWAGGVEDRDATTGNIAMTRVRSGFVTNVFGFSLVKQLVPNLKVTGRFATWVGVSQDRSKTDNPSLDAREAYMKLEGPWGKALLGRNLALFGSGGISIDYDMLHGFGLGHPCGVRRVSGGACGFAGHGLLFPGFNAGAVYTTPSLGGLELSAGLYDPAAVSERTYERTPLPRVEAQLMFRVPKYFHVYAEALWQKIGKNENKDQNPDSIGMAAGAGVTVGPLAVGGGLHMGKGLGLYVPMENSPLYSDQDGILRASRGFFGIASVKLADNDLYDTKIGAGAGVTQLDMTASESEPFTALNIPKQQLGISLGFYQGFNRTIVFALEYFRGQYQWYDSIDPATMDRKENTQGVNFINTGATLYW